MPRLFLAVPVATTPLLRAVLEELREFGSAIKTDATEQLHITLQFLGDTAPDLVPALRERMQAVAQRHSTGEATLLGLGLFPDARRPSVLWAGVEPGTLLQQIAADLVTETAPLGFQPESRPFKPHLTLARIKFRPPTNLVPYVEQQAQRNFGTLAIRSIDLFESELRPSGPIYTCLATAALRTKP